MKLEQAFHNFEHWLEGWPGGLLSVTLLVAAVVLVLIAFRGTPLEKAGAAAYVIFP